MSQMGKPIRENEKCVYSEAEVLQWKMKLPLYYHDKILDAAIFSRYLKQKSIILVRSSPKFSDSRKLILNFHFNSWFLVQKLKFLALKNRTSLFVQFSFERCKTGWHWKRRTKVATGLPVGQEKFRAVDIYNSNFTLNSINDNEMCGINNSFQNGKCYS